MKTRCKVALAQVAYQTIRARRKVEGAGDDGQTPRRIPQFQLDFRGLGVAERVDYSLSADAVDLIAQQWMERPSFAVDDYPECDFGRTARADPASCRMHQADQQSHSDADGN